MRKLVLKTAFATVGVMFVLAVSLFGIVSFCAPAMMMRFSVSLGLDNIGGDYAYQEYQNTGSIEYLARAFEIAAENDSYVVAGGRFKELYGEENSERRQQFADYCAGQNGVAFDDRIPEEIAAYDYRRFLCGLAARVRYHLVETDDEKAALVEFTLAECPKALTQDSPVFLLCAAARGDRDFVTRFLKPAVAAHGFEDNVHYKSLLKILEEI